jgi:DNA-binding Xre family transcriptional regulator
MSASGDQYGLLSAPSWRTVSKLLEEIRGNESLADQFRGLLLREMDKRHITEADLARARGCSLENIVQIFNGRTGLRFDTAEKLCRSIGLRMS